MLEGTLYRDQFSTPEMRRIWSGEATIDGWLRVEKTIAACQEALGIIAPGLEGKIAAVTRDDIDMERFHQDMEIVGRPIVGLLNQLRERVGADRADDVHFGTTTQDIMDTGMILQMKAGVDIVFSQLDMILARLEALAEKHVETNMIGRTNGQYAYPITVGMKFGVWIQELRRRRSAVSDAASRGLLVQFGGPVGDLRSFGPESGQVLKKMIAEKLDLNLCHPHWQSARDGVAEIVTSISLLCTSLEKIAHNINALSSSDVGEMYEKQRQGQGASSSMAHKMNQRCSEFAEAVSRLARQRAQNIHGACLHEHERSGGAWIAEWVLVPQIFLLTSGALMWTERQFDTLVIDTSAMKWKLDRHANSIGEFHAIQKT